MEIWKPVVGFEGHYEISDLGNCRSVERPVQTRNRWGPMTVVRRSRQLMPLPVGKYLGAQLSKEGKIKFRTLHTLVAEAFLGERPKGFDCCHMDGNPHNNTLVNLKWATKRENQSHRVQHGTHNRGARAYQAILTEDGVREIRRRRQAGEILVGMGKQYGVSDAAIWRAAVGKSWRHLE